MNREERERLIDGVLERALEPEAVEPRAGFEERLLANLPEQAERRPWWQWMWIPALAAAAVLAVVIGMRVMQKEQPAPVQVKTAVGSPKPDVAAKPEAPVRVVEPRRVIAKRAAPRVPAEHATTAIAKAEPLPRLDVFPSRGTLTPEEKLLVAFVRQQPSHARTLALERAAHAEEVQKALETGQVPAAGPAGITK